MSQHHKQFTRDEEKKIEIGPIDESIISPGHVMSRAHFAILSFHHLVRLRVP
jgi:hypothetical protein